MAKKVQFNEFVSWNTKYIVELMKNLVTFILLFWKKNILNMILGIHLTKMKCLKSISCVNLFNIEMYLIVKLTLTEAISHILRTTVTDIRMRFFETLKNWKTTSASEACEYKKVNHSKTLRIFSTIMLSILLIRHLHNFL